MSTSSKINQSVRWSALLSAWLLIIGLLQIVVFARFLSPEEFGIAAFIAVIVTICEVSVRVGFADAIIANNAMSNRQMSTLYWINVLTGLVVYGLLFLSAPLLATVFDHPDSTQMIRIAGTTVPLACLVEQFGALSRRELKFRLLAMVGFAQSLLAFSVAIIMASKGYGVWSLIISGILGQVVRTLALLAVAVKQRWLPGMEFELLEVIDAIKFGIYRIGAALLNNINSRSDQIAIMLMLGSTELGYYSLAYGIAIKPFQKINPILTKVSFPAFAKVSQDIDVMRAGYRKGLRLLMAINAPLLLGYMAVAPLVVPIVIGPGWEPVIPVSQLLCLYVLARSAEDLNNGLVLANRKYKWPFYWNLLLVVLIPATVFLASFLSSSLLVVSAALACIQALLLIAGYFLFARKLLGHFGSDYAMDFSVPVISAMFMAFVVVALERHLYLSMPVLQLGLLIIFGALTYLLISCFTQRTSLRELYRVIRPGS